MNFPYNELKWLAKNNPNRKIDMATRPKTIRLDCEVINKVNDLAHKENRTFINMVETILKKHLKSIKKNK